MKRGPPLDAALCRRLSRHMGSESLRFAISPELAAYVAKRTA